MNKTISIIVLATVLVIVIGGAWFLLKKPADNQQPAEQNQKSPGNYEIQGIKVEILQEGSGEPVKSGDKVTVNYVGILQDGTKFDSSIDRGKPFVFTLGENSVIQGWELGVAGMKVGEKRKLTIPPELAYGEQGAGGVIPPNATLVFEIDLLETN